MQLNRHNINASQEEIPHSIFRLLVLPAAVAMHLCLGAMYAWSTFVMPVRELSNLSQGVAQSPYTVFYICFPLSILISGMFLERLGTRLMGCLGGLIFALGWILGSFGDQGFIWTILCLGGLAGIGAGMAYLVPITVAIRWFPKRKALVTGIAVAGFGGGSAAVTVFSSRLMASDGAQMTPYEVFRILGFIFLAIVPIAGLAMKRPVKKGDITAPKIPFDTLKQRPFWFLFLFMVCGLMAGLTINANLKELKPGNTMMQGAWAIAAFAVGNALGRLIWGLAYDYMKSHHCIRTNLLMQAAMYLLSFYLIPQPFGLVIFALIVGFNYGGVLVIYPASVARIWGSEKTGSIYGWMTASNIVASGAPLLAGFSYDIFKNFKIPIITIAIILILVSTQTGRVRKAAEEGL
ncbi:MAG: MFS transporter [Candidatus Sumerlaeia bacterium]